MRPSTITQSGTNRTFGNDEVIVSKTDLQGRLTYVNDVFLRVARYEEHEVIGKPHNMIRHPDMPRAVFELLWREIQQGHEIFAYVKNLAGDGAHYWVFAHVTPSYHRSQMIGYHSNRRLPHPSAVEAITEAYRAAKAGFIAPFCPTACSARFVKGPARSTGPAWRSRTPGFVLPMRSNGDRLSPTSSNRWY